MKKHSLFVLLLFCLSTLSFGQILDQEYTPMSTAGGRYAVSNLENVGQSFVAGLTGYLSEVDFRIGFGGTFAAGEFELNIYSGNGYGGTVLATKNFTISNTPSTTNYDEFFVFLDPGSVPIIAGNTYTIDLRGINDSKVNVHGATAGYDNGGLYFNNGKPFFYETADLWFRTYVTVRTLGTNDFDISSSLKIYPNPATNQVKIDLQKLDNVNVEVSDSNGKKLFTQKLNNNSNKINIDNLASGTYFFKVNSSQGTATTKVIKN